MEDNAWYYRGPFERFFTGLKMAIMFVLVVLIVVGCRRVYPDYMMIALDKQTDEYYEYYKEQYDYLEDTIENTLNLHDQRLYISILPPDVFYQFERDEEGDFVTLYLDTMKEISADLSLAEDFEVIRQESHRLSKEDYQEQVSEELNSFMGITILVVMFCLLMIVDFLHEAITFVIYFLDLLKEYN